MRPAAGSAGGGRDDAAAPVELSVRQTHGLDGGAEGSRCRRGCGGGARLVVARPAQVDDDGLAARRRRRRRPAPSRPPTRRPAGPSAGVGSSPQSSGPSAATPTSAAASQASWATARGVSSATAAARAQRVLCCRHTSHIAGNRLQRPRDDTCRLDKPTALRPLPLLTNASKSARFFNRSTRAGYSRAHGSLSSFAA